MTKGVRQAGPPFRVSHVVLDVDGTLVDYVGALRAAGEAAAAVASELTGRPLGAEAIWETRSQVAREPDWRRRTNAEQRRESVRRLLAAAGIGSEAAIERVLSTYHRARDEAITMYPDVREALDALRGLGLTLVAASNGNLDLAVPGIAQYFAHLHFADEIGISKPDPRFFAAALEAVGARPEVTVAVGDRHDNDYEPARAAGMHAVLLDRDGRYEAGEVLRIGALTELPALLEPITAPAR